MSWQIPAFGLLAIVLVAGFAWYERSRPPSQVVALVAAMAALAIAGRIAFAPVPNVVPVTDIALITGFVLGPAPGFAVGALSALASNLWLGQGPWTPWQMGAWGLVGIAGAGLGWMFRGRIGRLPLAAACGVAGLAYGAILDLSLMVNFGGEQSLERYLALSARGVPFNLAHAGGNVVFALAVGPALIAMLTRYRDRFEFAWKAPVARAGVPACLLAALVLAAPTHPQPATAGQGGQASAGQGALASASAAGEALRWLRDAQNGDGGFGAELGDESSPAMTGWVALGLASAGVNPRDVRSGGPDAVAYISRRVDEVRTIGDIERTILVARAAGLDPRGFGGRDLVADLIAYRKSDGSWPGGVNPTAFGVLALAADGRTARSSARWLVRAQHESGGWAFGPGGAPDPDSTGAALQALAADGTHLGPVRRGVAYLRRDQRRSGGWVLLGGSVNAQSTSWAAQGLLAAGVDPGRVRTAGNSPLDYLASVQRGDGHYSYSRSGDQTPVWVTAQALAAVNGRSFPLDPVPRSEPTAGSTTQVERPAGSAAGEPKRGGGKRRAAARPAKASRSRRDSERVSGEPVAASAREAGSLPWIVAGSMLGLVTTLAGGWFAYRRRLPAPPPG